MFGRDVLPSLKMAVALINTSAERNGAEMLNSTDDLVRMDAENEIFYKPSGVASEILGMRKLRTRLDEVVKAKTQVARFAILNELFFSASAIPQIVTHEEDPLPHFHYTLEDATYTDHLKAVTAYALSRLTIMDEFDRLRTCEAADCNKLFIDISKNGMRRYCNSQTCGNRLHAARYRARKLARSD